MDSSPSETIHSSPFAQASITVPSERKRGNAWMWVCLTLLVVIGLSIGGIFLFRAIENPYRTLTEFPVDKYFSSCQSLSGARFKATLRVEADLGFKPDVGRLMVFSSPGDSRVLVVLIPPILKDLYFTKGQTYTAQVEVGDGGLIRAYSFEKD